MPIIYVLKCEKKRYYVGKTIRPLYNRVTEHFTANGNEWTKRYKPIKVLEIKEDADEFDEDKYTKKYMKLYGIDNVRGGSYTQFELPEYSKLTLNKELCSASDLCFRCNRPGHFAGECYAKTKADGSHIYEEEDDYDEEDNSDEDCWCCEYCDKEFSSKYAADKHEKMCNKLFTTTLKIVDKLMEEEPKNAKCFRCGREGHYANDCYARIHVNGKKL